MGCPRMLQLFALTCLVRLLHAEHEIQNYLVTAPQQPVVEVGTNFTATCGIVNTTEITADDLYWNLSMTPIPEQHYKKINATALSVTFPITSEKAEWLFCHSKKTSPYVVLNKSKFTHGIWLRKGYYPKRPENISCVAVQVKERISNVLKCSWTSDGHQTTEVPTTYTLTVKQNLLNKTFINSTIRNTAQVDLGIFPHHFTLEIWVEASNLLGRTESEHLSQESSYFVQTHPPSFVDVLTDANISTSLFINWSRPIDPVYVTVTYEIRYCQSGSSIWNYVPRSDISSTSFRLQDLTPGTNYTVQIRCKPKDHGYWSEWSKNKTEETSEARPSSRPDFWKTSWGGNNERNVQLICKDPASANGKIKSFGIIMDGNKWESIAAKSNSNQKGFTSLKNITLHDKQVVRACVVAKNSVGESPKACLTIRENPPDKSVTEMNVESDEHQLVVEWKHPNVTGVTEYVIEWVSSGKIDWKKEKKNTRTSIIKGKLEPFVSYNVSVYPVFHTVIGRPKTVQAFLRQGAPLRGPVISSSTPGYSEVELVWEEIPLNMRRGFITHYKVFYRNANIINVKTVPGNTTKCILKPLVRNTKYDVWIQASTIRGATNSSSHSFNTLKYAHGMVEGIVGGVSIGFLFLVLMTILLCVCKKDVIKQNFWPQIPNPGQSTIGNWSPDYPLKAETPRENCTSDICVLDAEACDSKIGFEEDNGTLPLKKDKYQSEEHSSGIGGDSCISSPCHSVSDSDESQDMAENIDSAVQYSSVVACSGYKGQTPVFQPQHCIFSRSESTQPLLDSEENADMSVQESSRQFHRFPRQPCFTQCPENKDTAQSDVWEQQAFCPLEEDTEQTSEAGGLSAEAEQTASSYMPQLGGYRPQ